jgi:hypothetical protein
LINILGLIYCNRVTISQPVLSQDYQAFQLFFCSDDTGPESIGQHTVA